MAGPSSASWQAELDRELEALLPKYPAEHRRAAMIPALRLCQERLGRLTPEAMAFVADRLGVEPAAAAEVATFYTMLHPEECGRHFIDLCTNVSCSLRGAERLLAHLEKRLGIRAGQTTSDKAITLREVECLASCGTAPCVQVDEGRYLEDATPAKLDALVEQLLGKPGQRA